MTSIPVATSAVEQLVVNLTTSEEMTIRRRGYNLVRKLGEGSYAKVYLSEYKTPNSTATNNSTTDVSLLACKIIDTTKAPKDFVRKFLPRELSILVRLNHPHIIHVHSIFQKGDKYFIFMRFAEMGDVLDYVLKNGAIPESQARIWFRQTVLAVQYLHELEIAHRDIKCENILITSNFNIKLADFGFAREVIDSRCKRVLSETYCGSLSYAAPEILKGSPYNPKMADIWACGVVLYIMLNKAMPFDDSNVKRLYDQQINHRWRFRAKVVDNLTKQVKALETHILEPDVSKRWRLDMILVSDWMAMDSRLLVLSDLENEAFKSATEESKKRCDGENNDRDGSWTVNNAKNKSQQKQMPSQSDFQPSKRVQSGAPNKDNVTVYKDVGKSALNASDEAIIAQEAERSRKERGGSSTPSASDVLDKTNE